MYFVMVFPTFDLRGTFPVKYLAPVVIAASSILRLSETLIMSLTVCCPSESAVTIIPFTLSPFI